MDTSSGGSRPQLKKIKRPINRTMPQTSAHPQSSTLSPAESGNPFVAQQAPAPSANGVNIDAYLDETPVPSKEVRDTTFDRDNNHTPQYIDERSYEEEVYGRSAAAELPEWLTMKIFFLIVGVCLFIGVVAGKFIFAESKVVRNGLQGVVVNAEVPRGRARCGVAERTQGCVLYIMNPQRQDMRAKDFYDLASQMTGRQRFMIETGNMRYANSKIRPGDIVQLNIPPL